jgi:hypothetical protein
MSILSVIGVYATTTAKLWLFRICCNAAMSILSVIGVYATTTAKLWLFRISLIVHGKIERADLAAPVLSERKGSLQLLALLRVLSPNNVQ